MKADYWNPVKIKFGRGALDSLTGILRGRKALLVTMPGIVEDEIGTRVKEICSGSLAGSVNQVIPNPTIASISECYREAGRYQFEVVIGLGGGSALDTAKVVALLRGGALEPGWLSEFFREGGNIDSGMSARPIIAIPTTAGTGSEATPWATVWDEKLKKKYSLADDRLFPEWALLDPDLTDSLPYDLTLFGSLDALSHAMEAVWNRNAGPVSTQIALKAVEIIMAVWGDDFRRRYGKREPRELLQTAALLAGLAFSNTKTALAHSISYPLTARLGLPHGLACGFTLPEILKLNGEGAEEVVKPLVWALGSASSDDAGKTLYEVFKEIGVAEILQQFVKAPSDIQDLQVEYISPGRADNNIVSADQKSADEIVFNAVKVLLGG